mgnify:CR=1 FL=1
MLVVSHCYYWLTGYFHYPLTIWKMLTVYPGNSEASLAYYMASSPEAKKANSQGQNAAIIVSRHSDILDGGQEPLDRIMYFSEVTTECTDTFHNT